MLSRSEVVSHFFLCDGEGVSGRRKGREMEDGGAEGIKGARVRGGRGGRGREEGEGRGWRGGMERRREKKREGR